MTPTVDDPIDRAAALRGAVRRVVAERGLHGASMSRIAREAGVAVGTAYVHFADKDDLVVAAYVEAKRELGEAATAAANAVVDRDRSGDPTRDRMAAMFVGVFRHLEQRPTDAVFILQVDVSPYWELAHARSADLGGDLAAALAAPAVRERLVDLPAPVLYEVGLAPAIRLAARRVALTDDQLLAVARACWDAITLPPSHADHPDQPRSA